jgi:hypothetical protein
MSSFHFPNHICLLLYVTLICDLYTKQSAADLVKTIAEKTGA